MSEAAPNRRRRRGSHRQSRVYGNRRDFGRNIAPPHGQRVDVRASSRGYDTTTMRQPRYSAFSRDTAEFAVGSEPERAKLRESCRQQERVSPIFGRIFNCMDENVIGNGATFTVATADEEWNTLAEAVLTKRFQAKNFAPSGTISEYHASRLALRATERDGGVIIYHASGRTQIFEDAQLHTPSHRSQIELAAGHTIRNGIEYAASGRVEAYWIGPYNKYGISQTAAANMIRLPAWHHDPDLNVDLPVTTYWRHNPFISGDRGICPNAAGLGPLESLDDYNTAMVERATGEACIMGALYSDRQKAAESLSLGRKDGDDDAAVEAVYDDLSFIEPQTIGHFHPDDKFEMHAPTSPGGMFAPFSAHQARLACIRRGLPLEVVMMHFDRNFSASRAAIEQAKRTWTMVQQDMVSFWYRPNIYWALYEAMLAGDLPYHPDWQLVTIDCCGWRYLNPKDDATANETALGTETNLTRVLSTKGEISTRDWLVQRAKEIAMARATAAELLGDPELWRLLLPYDRSRSPAAGPSPEPPAQEPDE